MDDLFFSGYERADGQIGIRNSILILYTVNCSAFVAQQICRAAPKDIPVQVIGNGSCFDNQIIIYRMLRLIAHGNVGAVLIVGHGCEFIQGNLLLNYAEKHRKPARILMDQNYGTSRSIEIGLSLLQELWTEIKFLPRKPLPSSRLIIGLTNGGLPTFSHILSGCLPQLLSSAQAACCSVLLNLQDFLTAQSMQTFQSLKSEEEISHFKAAVLKNIPFAFQGVLKISQIPDCCGLWLVDPLQDRHAETGIAATCPIDQVLDLICSGAHLVMLPSNGHFVIGTAIAPALILIPEYISEACMEEIDFTIKEKTSMETLWETLRPVLNGAFTASENLGMYDGYLLGSAQTFPEKIS